MTVTALSRVGTGCLFAAFGYTIPRYLIGEPVNGVLLILLAVAACLLGAAMWADIWTRPRTHRD